METVTREQKADSVGEVARMLELLGFAATVTAKEDGEGLRLTIACEEPGRLIGRKGQYLQSLELLLNRLMRRKHESCPWVVLDVDGYQSRPERAEKAPDDEVERLTRLALDAAKEVKRWGQPRRIGPFGPRDRRIVHTVLKEEAGIVSESIEDDGRGRKKVIISLASENT